MTGFFKYPFLLFFLLFINDGVFAQCLPNAVVWMENIVRIERSDNPLEEKIENLQSLHSLYLQCNNTKDSIYARMVHRLGDYYQVTGDVDQGISYTKEAISINSAKQPGAQRAYLAHSYFNLGLFYQHLNQLNEYHTYLDSCIQIGEEFQAKNFLALMALESKAFTYFSTGDYQKGIETSERGLILSKKANDVWYEAIFLLQKAQSHLALGTINEIEYNITQAISILTYNNAPAAYLATGYAIYAQLLAKQRRDDDAVRYYQKSFQLNKQAENWAQCSRDMLELGSFYDKELDEPVNAIAAYNQGIEMIQKTNDLYQLSGLYINMGVVYWRRADYRQALQNYQKALLVLPLAFNDTSWQYNPSPAALKFVSNDYFVSTLLANKGESLLQLYKEDNNKDYLHYALNSFKVADKMVDQMRWKQSGQESKLYWREKTKKMYEYAIETSYLLNDHESAFFFFEKSRAVLLNDKLSELGAKKYLSTEDLAKEQELRNKVLDLQQELPYLTENTETYDQKRQEFFAAQEDLEKFINYLERSYPVYYQYKYDTINYSVQEVRDRLLQGEQSLVEYFNGDSAIYALTITPTETDLQRINFEGYNTVSREMLMLASNKSMLNQNYNRYQTLAHQIYENLFQPLNLPTRRVIISQDDQFIPFESLLNDPNNAKSFLLNDYAFSYTYSASYLMKNSQEQASIDNSMLGIAPVSYQAHLQQNSLDGADFSLQNIKSYFSSAQLLIKEAATKKQFLANLSLYSIVHLYSHAVADSTEAEPILYLYDSTLTVNELQLLGDVHTKMILLSACKTGIGKNVQGEGVFSLARGFASAGIPSTITTLWEIDNQPTYYLSELFYKYLHQGLPSDEALQQAKLAFLQEKGRAYELPYFWASNILIGKTFVMQTGTRFTAKLTYLGLFVLLIALGIWTFWKIRHRNLSGKQLEPHEQ